MRMDCLEINGVMTPGISMEVIQDGVIIGKHFTYGEGKTVQII